MFTAQARVLTPSASRYVAQLCKHWGHKFAVEYTADKGTIAFAGDRRCTLEAASDYLTMTIEAPDEGQLARMEQVVVEHLRRFAFRENLSDVRWFSKA